MGEILPRDLKPGMKIIRLDFDLNLAQVEIGEVAKIKQGPYTGYRITPKAYLEDPDGIDADPERSHLMPFIAPNRYRLEVAD